MEITDLELKDIETRALRKEVNYLQGQSLHAIPPCEGAETLMLIGEIRDLRRKLGQKSN